MWTIQSYENTRILEKKELSTQQNGQKKMELKF